MKHLNTGDSLTSRSLARTLGGALALVATLGLAGCDEEAEPSRGGGGPSGGKADDAEGDDDGERSEAQQQHLAEVGECESVASRGRSTVSDLRIADTLEIEQTRLECLRDANDATTDELNAALSSESSDLAGESDDNFEIWREKHEGFCSLMVEASESALGKDASVVETACLAQAELVLAEAIEAFGDLGGVAAKAPEADRAYEDCYETYEDALEAEPTNDAPEDTPEETPEDGTPEEPTDNDASSDATTQGANQIATEATEALADCIQEATEEVEDDIESKVVESFPGRASTGIEDEINDTMRDATRAADSVCDVLVSSSGGDDLATANCEVATSIWRHELIGYVVPPLSPIPPEN